MSGPVPKAAVIDRLARVLTHLPVESGDETPGLRYPRLLYRSRQKEASQVILRGSIPAALSLEGDAVEMQAD